MRICSDIKTKEYLLNEINIKQNWQNQKIKEYFFSNSSGNAFLQELIPYKDVINFKVNDLKEIMNGEDNENKNSKLKAKLLNLMERNINYEKTFSCVSSFMSFLNRRKEFKRDNSGLFDYFQKNNKNSLDIKCILKSKQRNISTNSFKSMRSRSVHDLLKKKTLFEENLEGFKNFPTPKAKDFEKKEYFNSDIKKKSMSLHNLNLNKIIPVNDCFLPITERSNLTVSKEKWSKHASLHENERKTNQYKIECLPLKYKTQKKNLDKKGKADDK